VSSWRRRRRLLRTTLPNGSEPRRVLRAGAWQPHAGEHEHQREARGDAGRHADALEQRAGRRVEVHADLDQVTVSCDRRLVAQHQRCWAARQTITDPAHRDAAAALRTKARLTAPKLSADVEHRALADYDRAFGLDEVA
jgi:hypothetical protein